MTDRQTDRHCQSDRQTDIVRQTDRHCQTDRQTDRQTLSDRHRTTAIKGCACIASRGNNVVVTIAHVPREIFSPASGGRLKVRRAMLEIMAQGMMRTLEMTAQGMMRLKT